jgi:hypothetical protein
MKTDVARTRRMTSRRETVDAIVSRHMRRWGVERHDVGVTWDRDGSTVPTLSTGGRCGSMRSIPFGEDGLPDREGVEAIAAICFQAVRRILRARSMTSAGIDEGATPAWTISGDPVVLSCLRHYRVDLSEVGTAQDLLSAIRKSGLTVDNGDIQDGLVRVGALGDREDTWSISDYDRFRIHVNVPVPDTVLTALGGMRPQVEDVVLLPFPVPQRRVRRIRRGSGGGIDLQLSRRLATLAPAPDGIDTAWLRVPQCQVQDIPF